MNEELKQLLRQEFIKTIIEDEDSFEDTNAGFRKFLKRKGAPVFNYKKGGKVAKEERSKAEEPLSNYESYSENELLSSLDAKMPNLQIVDDELVTMPKFKPSDVLPPNADPESFPDTNAGFRRFLKRKGSPVFNYKKGGEVKEPKQTDAEIEEEIRENKKELLGKKSILDLYKGNTLFGLDLDFADKNIGGEFGQYNKKDIKDPRIGLSIIPNVQDDTSSRWGISIGPKGGGLTFMKPFSQIGLSGDWEEVPESWYEDNIPDVNVLIPELPEMKKGGKVVKEKKSKAEEPLSKYESYSENELLSSLDAKMPNLEIIEDELITMPMFEPRDIVPKGARPIMPSLEGILNAIYKEPIGIKNGGYISKGGKVNTNLTKTIPPVKGPNSQGVESLFKKR